MVGSVGPLKGWIWWSISSEDEKGGDVTKLTFKKEMCRETADPRSVKAV